MSETLQVIAPGNELDAAGRLLVDVLELFDRAGIAYSLLHSYENYPRQIDSDVDCLMSPDITPARLAALFLEHRDQLHADVVQWLADGACMVVLHARGDESSPRFLQLHVAYEYELGKRTLYTAQEVLQSRRRYKHFWVPAPEAAFTALLARRVVKGRLEAQDRRRLEDLYRSSPDACQGEAARFWNPARVNTIHAAAQSGDWEPVVQTLPLLRKELLGRLSRRRPLRWIGNLAGAAARRARKWLWRDRGLNVVLLGTDGSGKSSVGQAVAADLAPAFTGHERRTFPPGLRRRGPRGTNSTPHAAAPRSYAQSVFRALAYWLPYYTLGHAWTTGRRLRRNRLVIHDRHLVDALVDPRRYRYGGPRWLLQAIWRLTPQPDLVILLDAPPEVAQARKQEVPLAETARQRDAYRQLVAALPRGHVVDAAQDLDRVVADVNALVLRFLAARAARRWRKEPRP